MRVGEACNMTALEIDMTGPVWLYCPAEHKLAWRGPDYQRAIAYENIRSRGVRG